LWPEELVSVLSQKEIISAEGFMIFLSVIQQKKIKTKQPGDSDI
jgi:hypothetical protein